MKKFEFKLQALLKIREAKEKEIKNELAKLMQVQNLERTKQESLRRGIEEQKQKYHEKFLKEAYSSGEVLMFERFIDVSYRAIEGAEIKIQEMEPAINEVRQRLIEASKERKVVEKLKERKLEEYNYEYDREIAKESDDMNQKIYLSRKISNR